MDSQPIGVPGSPEVGKFEAHAAQAPLRRLWNHICERILSGLFLVLPLLITFYIIYWLYSILEKYVIDPVAQVVLWKLKWTTSSTELPEWFERFVAPLIAIIVVLVLLYCCDYFSNSRMRWTMAWVLRRVPLVSQIYSPIQKMFQAMEKQPGQQGPQRLVLIKFPHPGVKLPAFVTAECRDVETQKVLLCVYVPTTPVPTSGFFLIVPEDEVTELNWNTEQALQAIMSGGLTAPPQVSYFRTRPAVDLVTSEVRSKPDNGGRSLPG
jgi:uncharacterized membrane protein